MEKVKVILLPVIIPNDSYFKQIHIHFLVYYIKFSVKLWTVFHALKKNRTFNRKVKWIFGEIRTFHNTDLDVSKVGLQSCLQH